MVGAAVGMGPVAIAEKIGALRSAEELLQLVEAHGPRFSGEHVQSALASLAKAVCSQRPRGVTLRRSARSNNKETTLPSLVFGRVKALPSVCASGLAAMAQSSGEASGS